MDGRRPDLAGVVAAEPPLEVANGVGKGERRGGGILAQELAQGAPALADVVLEQALGRHQLADAVVVPLEDLDAAVLKIALEQPVPEGQQHGAVEREGPVKVRDDLGGRVREALVDGFGGGPWGGSGQPGATER